MLQWVKLMKKNATKEDFLYGIIALVILSLPGIFWTKGPWFFNDSREYVSMYAYLPSLYPVYLKLLQIIFGQTFSLYAAILIQTVFAAYVVVILFRLICNTFEPRKLFKPFIFILLLLTYFKVDEYDPNCNLWILTEGLSYSLFYLFVFCSIVFLIRKTYTAYIKLIVVSTALMLCRTQFIVCFGMVVLYLGYLLVFRKINIKLCFGGLLGVVVGLALTSGVQACYERNADQTDVNIFNSLTIGTHFYYYAEENDAERIEDEGERELFLSIYEKMVSNGNNYKNTGWLEDIKNYRDSYPPLRGIVLNEIRSYVTDQMGIQDKFEVDEVGGEILKRQMETLDVHFWQWTWDSLKQLPASIARAIALWYEPLQKYCVAYVIIFGSLYIGVNILLVIQKKALQIENLFCIFQLMFTIVNAVVTQMMIRSIMRYVAYTFGLFYISGLLVVLALFRKNNQGAGNGLRVGKFENV